MRIYESCAKNPDIIIIVMEGKEGREGMEGGKGGKEGKEGLLMLKQHIQKVTQYILKLNQCFTVCLGSSDPPEKIF